MLREPLFPLPSARGFADEKDFCRACDAWSTAGGIINVVPAANGKTILTCCLDLIYTRFEHNTTLDYLREDMVRLFQVKTWIRGEWGGVNTCLVEVEDEIQLANVLESPV